MKPAWIGGLAALGMMVGTAERLNASVIAGPLLDSPVGGHTQSGIQFTALVDSTITGFDFINQGNGDLIALEPAGGGAPLYTLVTPAGTPDFAASVSWNVTAGQSYWLLQTIGAPTQDNGTFGSFSSFPVSNSDISVTSGVFSTTTFFFAWGDFNNITTVVPVPEASHVLLAAVGALAVAGFARRRFFAAA